MNKIGIVGGLGPEATVDYYRIIIDSYRKKQKGNYPELIIYSLNIKKLSHMLKADERDKQIDWLTNAVRSLHKAGADFALIASNTPHLVFDEVKVNAPIPMISIVEETCKKAKDIGLKKVGLMGTKVTMSSDFYSEVFSKEDITVLSPNKEEQDYIHKKLVTEIMFNKIVEETRQGLLKIVKRMIDEQQIEGLILGCTELPLILTKDEFGIPFLNTTKIHAQAAVREAL